MSSPFHSWDKTPSLHREPMVGEGGCCSPSRPMRALPMRGTPPLAPPTELIGERFVGEAALALRLFRLGNPARGLFARPPPSSAGRKSLITHPRSTQADDQRNLVRWGASIPHLSISPPFSHFYAIFPAFLPFPFRPFCPFSTEYCPGLLLLAGFPNLCAVQLCSCAGAQPCAACPSRESRDRPYS